MSGLPNHNFPAFDQAKIELESLGHDVSSPADIDRKHGYFGTGPVSAELEDAFKRDDVQAILDADALYMLPGWEYSKGARNEHAMGAFLNKKFIYENAADIADEMSLPGN